MSSIFNASKGRQDGGTNGRLIAAIVLADEERVIKALSEPHDLASSDNALNQSPLLIALEVLDMEAMRGQDVDTLPTINIVKRVVKQGLLTDPDHKSLWAKGALNKAVYKAPFLVEYLVNQGLDINQNSNEYTEHIVWTAAMYSNSAVMAYALKHQAVQELMREKHKEFARLLLDALRFTHPKRVSSTKKIIKQLVKVGFDVNAKVAIGDTEWHRPVFTLISAVEDQKTLLALLETLVACGLDLSLGSEKQMDVLSWAEQKGTTEKVMDYLRATKAQQEGAMMNAVMTPPLASGMKRRL